MINFATKKLLAGFFALPLILTACGGGGGSSAPITSIPVKNLPAVISIPAGYFDAAVTPFAPLVFAAQAVSYSDSANIGNAIFKPTGVGPFPSIVLTHSCGGAVGPIRERLQEFLDAGYLVLVLDSFGPRGQVDCRNGVIKPPRVWNDVVDALTHLQSVTNVDVGRIYQVGYSLGSFSATALSSPSMVAYFNSPYRFKASVGWYGSCAFRNNPSVPISTFLRADTDRPLLMLMADADRETPVQPFCFPLLDDLKAAGIPVEWHLYPAPTTHAWDVRTGYTIVNGWGETVVNSYDAGVTADATRRTLEFLSKHQ